MAQLNRLETRHGSQSRQVVGGAGQDTLASPTSWCAGGAWASSASTVPSCIEPTRPAVSHCFKPPGKAPSNGGRASESASREGRMTTRGKRETETDRGRAE